MYPKFSQQAFDMLTKGRHLCAADGEVYQDLHNNQAQYEALFAAIGFKLVCDPRGFAYFTGEAEGSIAQRMERAALLVFLITDRLSDKGIGVEEGFFSGRPIQIADLVSDTEPRRASLLRDAGLLAADERVNTLRYMARCGFLVYHEDRDAVSFQAPVRRIIDLALNAAEEVRPKSDDAITEDADE
jgi:glycosyltransferase involved in cell wall biosynthesis